MEVTPRGRRWHSSQILKEGKMLIVEIRLEDRASQVEGMAWAKGWRREREKHGEGNARDTTVNEMD